MLPSLSYRLLVLIGITAGALAIFLSEWGGIRLPDLAWKALAGVAMLCLFSLKYMPRGIVDDAQVRSAVGDHAINTLVWIRRLAIAIALVAVILAVLMGPFVAGIQLRRVMLELSGVALLISMVLSSVVEVRYRALVRRSGVAVSMRG
jgi:hypothetical protein